MLFRCFTSSRNRPSRILAVNCGAAHVAGGLFLRDKENHWVLERFARATFDPDPALAEGWSEIVAEALRSVSAQISFAGGCRLALPGHHTWVKFVRTPSVGPTYRKNVVDFEAQRNIPCPLEEVTWDHVVVRDDGLDLELMLGAAKRELLKTMEQGATGAALQLDAILPSGFCVWRAFRQNYPELREGALTIDIGARTTQLVLVEENRFYFRTLALGGNTLTQALAEELKIEFGPAELLKLEIASGRSVLPSDSWVRETMRQAVAQFVNRLHRDIVRSLAVQQRQSGGRPPGVIYFSGGGSLVPEIPRALADKLMVRFESFDPLRHVAVAATMSTAEVAEARPYLANLVGLVSEIDSDGETPFTLLPTSTREAQAIRRTQSIWLATAVLAAAAPMPLVWHQQRVIDATGDAAATLEQRLTSLRGFAARNAERVRQIEEATQEITTLQRLLESRSSWVGLLSDVQARLAQVEDVWLEKLELVRTVAASSAVDEATLRRESSLVPDCVPSSPALRLKLTGCLLDRNHPLSKVSPDSLTRVKTLLALFRQSQFVAAVEAERFDTTQPGILRFDFMLVVNPSRSL